MKKEVNFQERWRFSEYFSFFFSFHLRRNHASESIPEDETNEIGGEKFQRFEGEYFDDLSILDNFSRFDLTVIEILKNINQLGTT